VSPICVVQLEGPEKQWQRKHHLVAKGGVELLSLQAEDFSYITKADEGKVHDYSVYSV